MNIRPTLFALLLLAVYTAPVRGDAADAVLDALHEAGAAADPAGFLAQMTTDAVVLGADGTGPLEGPALRSHIDGRFDDGEAWGYRGIERTVRYSGDGNMAWFTESLENSEGDRSWGSGVLVRTGAGWKIAQYALTAPTIDTGTTSALAPPVAETDSSTGTDAPQSEADEHARHSENAESHANGQQKRKRCRKMRHKTNRASSC